MTIHINRHIEKILPYTWAEPCYLLYGSLPAQYFFTGEVKDTHGDKLQNGSILVQSTGSLVNPGHYGEFEIISRRAEDSLTLSFDGYEPYTTAVRANQYLQVTLKKPSIPENPNYRSIKCVYSGAKDRGFLCRSRAARCPLPEI